MIRVEALAVHHADRWRGLFERSNSACHCRYWHFGGDKNSWLERCAFRESENADEASNALRSGDASAMGVVAIDTSAADEPIVGWVKVAPRASLQKLRKLPVYRALDLGEDTNIFSIGCFLVDPSMRRHGVAKALLRGAIDFARECGADFLEAYPRRAEGALHDAEAWLGPYAIFTDEQFVAIHDDGPYPVLRKAMKVE